MVKILLLHGVNLNTLGKRDKSHYGSLTLKEIETLTANKAAEFDAAIHAYQSNHEGDLVDFLQAESASCDGIIINPGAFSHYSYALHDAIVDTGLPTVEVHLSDIHQRESFRRHSVTAAACVHMISGKKEVGYLEAVEFLMEKFQR